MAKSYRAWLVTGFCLALCSVVKSSDITSLLVNDDGILIIGKIIKCESIKPEHWKIRVSEFRNIIGNLDGKDVEINFNTTMGGLIMLSPLVTKSPPSDAWIGKTVLVNAYRRNAEYFVPSARKGIRLSPDRAPLYIFTEGDSKLIEATSRVLAIFASENESTCLRELVLVVEDDAIPVHLRHFAAEKMVFLSRWAKNDRDNLFMSCLKRLAAWRDNDKMPVEIRFYADDAIASETFALKQTVEYLWDAGRLRFLSMVRDAANMTEEMRRKARGRLEEAERIREEFKAGRWKPPPEI